jgi:hypothetical protein
MTLGKKVSKSAATAQQPERVLKKTELHLALDEMDVEIRCLKEFFEENYATLKKQRKLLDEIKASNDELKKSSEENAILFGEPMVKNVTNEILLRIVERSKDVPGPSNFAFFEKSEPHQFKQLSDLIGEGHHDLASVLDRMIYRRNSSSPFKLEMCALRDLDRRVEAVKMLGTRHPKLRSTMSDQFAIIQNYESIKSLFLVCTK